MKKVAKDHYLVRRLIQYYVCEVDFSMTKGFFCDESSRVIAEIIKFLSENHYSSKSRTGVQLLVVEEVLKKDFR